MLPELAREHPYACVSGPARCHGHSRRHVTRSQGQVRSIRLVPGLPSSRWLRRELHRPLAHPGGEPGSRRFKTVLSLGNGN